MNIVNITDIEELILCKHEIDLSLIEHGDIEEKMTLPEFMNKYVNLNNTTYIHGSEMISFSLFDVYDKKYLLVVDTNDKLEKIVHLLKSIQFDFSKLKPITNKEIIESESSLPLILHDSKYYRID